MANFRAVGVRKSCNSRNDLVYNSRSCAMALHLNDVWPVAIAKPVQVNLFSRSFICVLET